MIASYVAWRADQVLYGSYTLDIDSDNGGSCIFVQGCALGGEAKYGRPFENLRTAVSAERFVHTDVTDI